MKVREMEKGLLKHKEKLEEVYRVSKLYNRHLLREDHMIFLLEVLYDMIADTKRHYVNQRPTPNQMKYLLQSLQNIVNVRRIYGEKREQRRNSAQRTDKECAQN